MMKNSTKSVLPNQRGMALIASLVIMLLMTLVAISVFRGSSLFEKIAGNTREKQRAMQMAQDALLYGEYWTTLSTSVLTTTSSVCTGSPVLTGPQVCTTPATASNLLSMPLFIYNKSGNTLNTSNGKLGGGLSSTAALSDINYSQNPGIYIAYLGLSTLPNTPPVYQITAVGYGGSGGQYGTVVMVQSTYVPPTTTTTTTNNGGCNTGIGCL